MTRADFLTAIAGAATAVKAVAQTEPDGSAPKTKRLLAIECPERLSPNDLMHMFRGLAKFDEKYGVEFIILCGGMRIVDPSLPGVPSK